MKRANEKKRICRELKQLGISKTELAELVGVHYSTIKWALNHAHPGWSERVIAKANEIINEAKVPQ